MFQILPSHTPQLARVQVWLKTENVKGAVESVKRYKMKMGSRR